VAEEELDGIELASDDGPVEGGLAVAVVGGEVGSVFQEEFDDFIAAVCAGVEEGVAAVIGRGVGEQSLDGIEMTEAGGGGEIDGRAFGGEEFGGLGVAVAEAGGDEGGLIQRRTALEELFR
jgi:hypothetical protein